MLQHESSKCFFRDRGLVEGTESHHHRKSFIVGIACERAFRKPGSGIEREQYVQQLVFRELAREHACTSTQIAHIAKSHSHPTLISTSSSATRV